MMAPVASMKNGGSRSLGRLRGAWPLGLFALGGVLIVGGVALVSLPAALVIAGILALTMATMEVL